MSQLLLNVTPFKPVITESKEKPGVYIVEGILQRATAKNQNGRTYSKAILEREADRYTKEFIEVGNAFGELDHPDDSVINLKNVSHLIVDVWWEGKDVMGKMKILDTPSGKTLKELINAGVKLGISSRGLGSVRESMGKTVVENDFQLICFDIVSEPSTPNAYVHPDKQAASPMRMRENKENTIDNLFTKILGD